MLTVNWLVAPTFIVKVAGTIETTCTGGGLTFTTAEALEPFRLAVIPACPYASVPTENDALVAPCGTVTEAGTDTMLAGEAAIGTTVSVDWAAEIVSVSVVLAPSVTVEVTGSSDTTVGGAGVTVTWLEAEEPFRLAVICALPGATALTGTLALTCPAETVTEEGTVAKLVLLLDSVTCVSLVCAALIVTVRLPLAPCTTVSEAGAKLVTVGGAGVTFTVALALPPFRLALTVVLPGPTPVTGIVTWVWPAANATLAGTVAILVFALDTASVPAAVGAGESVAVRFPEAPAVTESGSGASEVGLGKFGVPNTVTVMTVPFFPATCSETELLSCTVTVLST
jgi:hypothetical protein